MGSGLFQRAVRWRQFRALEPGERRALAATCVQLPLIGLALRCIGFSRAKALLAHVPCREHVPANRHVVLTLARLYAAAIDRVAHHGLYRASCLERSLLLWSRLRREGVYADLRIGVCKDAGQLAAHAWVEHQGAVLNDSDDVGERFAAFAEPVQRAR